MSTTKYWTFLLLGTLILCGIGCSDNIQVRGVVTFSDDGTPLTVGTVFFENDTMMARGSINEDGTFRMGSEGQTDGLLPGTYNVYVANALGTAGNPVAPQIIPLIDPKYTCASTSGITVTVDRTTSRTPLEIQVGRFGTR